MSVVFREFLESYGVLGVFIVSFLGNVIPYSTIPYLFFIVVYTAFIHDIGVKIAIIVSGGLGAALGKLVVYYIGRTARIILSEESRRNIELFTRLAGRGIFFAVFVFAALPLPDDILYVPLGVSGYSVSRYFIALIAGKIIITGLAVVFGESVKFLALEYMDTPWYIYVPTLILATIILTYIVLEINWVRVAEIGDRDGSLKATWFVFKEVFRVILAPFKKIYNIIVKK